MSYRWRRRLGWLSIVLAFVGAAVALGVRYSNTGHSTATPITSAKPQIDVEPASVPLTSGGKSAALDSAKKFIATAVLRQHPERSWTLTAPSLKQGYTYEQWRSGNIPVVPYRAADLAFVKSNVSYSYAKTIGLDVVMIPKPTAHQHAIVFSMELTAVGPPKKRHWLVDSWVPNGVEVQKYLNAPPTGSGPVVKPGNQLGMVWLFVPLALIGMLVLIPVTIAVRGWLRGRRAMRAYEAERLAGEARSNL